MEIFDIDAGKSDNVPRLCLLRSRKNASNRRKRVSQNFSLHENYRDEEPAEAGGDRAFGCTVGSILMVIGAAKAFAAGGGVLVSCFFFFFGALLLLLRGFSALLC